MKKDIQLVGLGNALVDVQFNVTEEELREIGVEKGAMTLTSTDAQKKLLDRFDDRQPHRSSGGSAGNTIIAFSGMGGKSAFNSILGDDKFGHFYKGEFDILQVGLSASVSPDDHTGTCIILITPDAERTLNTSLGVNTTFSPKNIDRDLISRAEWLLIEGYKFTETSGTEAIHSAIECAKSSGTKVAVSFSDGFIIHVFGDELRRAVAEADLVFCNKAEALAFTGKENAQSAFEALCSHIPNVVMTRGASGSTVKWDGNTCEVEPVHANAIDNTGAGDMYSAGFMFGVVNEWSAEKAGRLASLASSKIVAQYGARYVGEFHVLVKSV